MNLDIPPLNNPKVREAISLATDTEDIVNGLFNGMKALSHTVLPSGIPGFNPNAKPHVYDPARAKVLLAEAGFPNGVEIIATTAGDWVTILEVVKSQYEKVGITLDIQRMDDATFSDVIDNGKAQFIIWEWYADFMDGDMYMYTIFYSKQATAFSTGFRDSWFDAQVEKARRTSGAEKAAIYSELDDYIVNNVHMVIPIFQDRGFVLMSDRVKNVFMKKDLLLTFRNAVIE
jgi:ABC-type transport system substrate-binding protein